MIIRGRFNGGLFFGRVNMCYIIVIVIAAVGFYLFMLKRRISRINRNVKMMMHTGDSFEDVIRYLKSEGYTESGAHKFIKQITYGDWKD